MEVLSLAKRRGTNLELWCLSQLCMRENVQDFAELLARSLVGGDARSALTCTLGLSWLGVKCVGECLRVADIPPERIEYVLALCCLYPEFCTMADVKGWASEGLKSDDAKVKSLALGVFSGSFAPVDAVSDLVAEFRRERDPHARAGVIMALKMAKAKEDIWAMISGDIQEWAPIESAAWLQAVADLHIESGLIRDVVGWMAVNHPWSSVRRKAKFY